MINNDETTGVLAAIAAPFFMALGFIIWDVTWKASGGSAFALNLFKCNLAAVGFLVMSFLLGWTTTSSSTTTTFDDENENTFNEEMIIYSSKSISFLILSGFIGIIIGDLAWLESLRLLGATKVLVIDCIKPFTAALMGWLVLKESIQNVAYSGIILTVLGIFIISFEKEKATDNGDSGSDSDSHENENENDIICNDFGNKDHNDKNTENISHEDEIEIVNLQDKNKNHHYQTNSNVQNLDGNESHDNHLTQSQSQNSSSSILPQISPSSSQIDNHQHSIWWNLRGYVFAIGNVILDTYGSILTKQYGQGMSTWSINLIRFGSAGIIMLLISVLSYICTKKDKRKYSNQYDLDHQNVTPWYLLPKLNIKGWLKICTGVLFVTFICPALSNYALFQITLAFALTLGSIAPLYALLLEWPIHRVKPSIRAITGACLAAGGVTILSILQH